MKVLLIDENAKYYIFLKHELKKLTNLSITLLDINPYKALELITQEGFHLVIINRNNSTINDIVLHKKIKELNSKTNVIFNNSTYNVKHKIDIIKNIIQKFYTKFNHKSISQEIELLKRFNNFDRIKEL